MADVSDRLVYGGQRWPTLSTGGGRARRAGPAAGGGTLGLLQLGGQPGGFGTG